MKTRLELITIREMEFPLQPDGDRSIGQVVDNMIASMLEDDQELNKLSLEFDDADRHVLDVKRSERSAKRHVKPPRN